MMRCCNNESTTTRIETSRHDRRELCGECCNNESTTTRIETSSISKISSATPVAIMNPLQQGLKHS